MTVGIPGVGLGGIFYLLSAVLMPVRELWRVVRGRAPAGDRRVVVQQTAMAAAILAALWATGWLLGLVITESAHPVLLGARGGHSIAAVHNVLRAGALVLSLGTLALVLATVQIARLVVRRGGGRTSAPLEPAAAVDTDERARDLRVDSGTFGRAQ